MCFFYKIISYIFQNVRTMYPCESLNEKKYIFHKDKNNVLIHIIQHDVFLYVFERSLNAHQDCIY